MTMRDCSGMKIKTITTSAFTILLVGVEIKMRIVAKMHTAKCVHYFLNGKVGASVNKRSIIMLYIVFEIAL